MRCQVIFHGENQLIFSRSKLSIGCCIISVIIFAVFVIVLVVGLIYSINLTAYILMLCFFGILSLFSVHKSNFVKLNNYNLKFRKYFILQTVKYANIPIVFITKHMFETRFGIYEFHDKKNQIVGCIFFMKELSLTIKKTLSNSYHMNSLFEDEWSNVYIDVAYQKRILEIVLQGGFRGRFCITTEMYAILGNEIEGLLKEYNPQINLEIIDIMQN